MTWQRPSRWQRKRNTLSADWSFSRMLSRLEDPTQSENPGQIQTVILVLRICVTNFADRRALHPLWTFFIIFITTAIILLWRRWRYSLLARSTMGTTRVVCPSAQQDSLESGSSSKPIVSIHIDPVS